MVTYEDITDMFLAAMDETELSVHPEFWLNTQTLEREFACTMHRGPCEEAEDRAGCTVSFAWAPLDTVLSYDGAEGVCEFFHEPDEDCPHLHTENVPPLVLDLSYTLPLQQVHLPEMNLSILARLLKLRASEHSSRASETRPSISLTLGDNAMETESLTLQQRVELPLWDPEGADGFRASGERHDGHLPAARGRRGAGRAPGGTPHPEDWLPHLFAEVASDVVGVLAALEDSQLLGRLGGAADTSES